ncbi:MULTISPECIES: winged helix DNA-binding domain-containing protein [Streptomyces]|uniref:Winged helix DNA-binding domain-containing protein n=1 Tax=Streptomyces doudnae TaxID=3075536 RepID=A0ABD5F0L2_9ACTN|nr:MULTISPECIES: winged helix DNA-binding domain-containing protein [unclassified Streptomyces]MDT0440149.1 winged helix DNA-binding domain-containing protein [Streptomyces sp. DSM 41981]MYQ68054.1 winged helix DNA-binding domain-containing protein [Streptomyces sp. SID4950]
MCSLSHEQARALRSRAQGIGGGVRYGSAAEVVERVLAVQAQDVRAAALGIRARADGLTAADVRRALEEDRTIVRAWFLRGTLHTVPSADLPWLLGLLGPHFLRLGARRYRELGLDENLCDRAEAILVKALGDHGPATRAELTEHLARIGVAPRGQAPFHLIRRAALRGLVCHGPERDGEATFVLLTDWLPSRKDGPRGEAAETELARRYLRAHAPASPEDFASWSGLPMTAARRAWRALGAAGHLTFCHIADEASTLPTEHVPEMDLTPSAAPDVRLLPAYDDYLVGYCSRALSVPAAHERQVWPGGGQIRPAVVADGLARGTWTSRTSSTDTDVSLFAPDSEEAAALAKGIATESADVARFLGSPR